MTGQEQHGDLVQEFAVVEARAGLGVHGGDQGGHDVVLGRGIAPPDGGQTALDRRFQDAADHLGRGLGAPVAGQQPGRHPRQLQHAVGVGDLLEDGEGLEEPPGAGRIHRFGEDGAEDHVGSVMGHLHIDRHGRGAIRPVGMGADARHAGVHRIQHHREHRADAGALEGRVHQAAVPLPGLAVGDEDAVAGQGPQHVVHQRTLGEVLRAPDQHLADQLGRAHGEQPALVALGHGGDRMAPDGHGLVAARQEHADARTQAVLQVLQEAGPLGQDRRAGRDEVAHAGSDLAATFTSARRSGPAVNRKKS